MIVRPFIIDDDLDRLLPLLVLWKRECGAEGFGMTVDIGKMLEQEDRRVIWVDYWVV